MGSELTSIYIGRSKAGNSKKRASQPSQRMECTWKRAPSASKRMEWGYKRRF